MDDDIIAQMVELGASQADIEAATRAKKVAEDFELFEDNALSVTVFDAMATQWRLAGDQGLKVGLDYVPLPFVMRMCGVKPEQRAQIFEDVRIMEIETIAMYAERERAA